MNQTRDTAWWYWLASAVLLVEALAGCPLGVFRPRTPSRLSVTA